MNKITSYFKKLYSPFASSVKGKLSWREVGSAVCLAILFFLSGGTLESFTQFVLTYIGANPGEATGLVMALVALVTSLLHKKEQGEDTKPKVIDGTISDKE